jgi:acyl carrier protein
MSAIAVQSPRLTRRVVTGWRIRRFIMRQLIEEPFPGRDPLAADALDSLAIEQLIRYIEDTFEIHLEDAELVRANFSSISALAALVNEKRRLAKGVDRA